MLHIVITFFSYEYLFTAELVKAYKVLENDDARTKCLEVVEEAEAIVSARVSYLALQAMC